MIEIKQITVSNELSIEYLLVSFSIADTTESTGNYQFSLLRSASSPDDMDQYALIEESMGGFLYQDTSVNLLKGDLNYYYRIRVTNMQTGETELSSCYGHILNTAPDRISFASLFEAKRALEMISNDTVMILPRIRSGQRCLDCWDDIRRQTSDPNCPSCYGVGYADGYAKPIPAKICYLSPASSQQDNITPESQEVLDSQISAWVLNYPVVMKGDIVVQTKLNYRWRVVSVQPIKKNGRFILRQILNLQKIPESQIEYSIPVEVPS